LLIFLLIVVVLVVVADRVAAKIAEQQVAAKVQTSQHLSQKPKVTIEGFPFLTQVARNRYSAVRLSAANLTVTGNGQQVQLDSLKARLTGVRATNHYSGVTAEHVAGTAILGYAALSSAVGVPLSYAAGGRVQATKSVELLGKTVSANVSAVVTVPGGDQLAFSDIRVSIADASVGVPSAVSSQLSSIFAQQLSLTGLPFGLRIDSLDVSAAGVTVSAQASNVSLG
jgi:hypothetical protein